MVFAPVNASGSKASHSLYDVVEDVPAGSVMIVDAANSSLAAWGGNVSGACVRRDVAGAVIDGATRDVEELRDLNFPVFCRSIWSMGFPRLLEVVAKEVPVTCCGLRVDPEDIVVADIDGVAVVPQGRIEEVKRQVERIHAIEREVKERREKGESMSALFPLLAKKFTTD
jgi:regulator of RNase E activity RraA